MGTPTTGPGTLQQIWPAVQQVAAQQNSLDWQVMLLQGGSPQVPMLQYGWSPPHLLVHVPQLRMSFFRFTHAPLQQPNPGMVQLLHPPPELVLDELAWPELLDEPVLPELSLPELLDPVLFVAVVVAPPAPPLPALKLPLQPASAIVPIAKARKVLLMNRSYPRTGTLAMNFGERTMLLSCGSPPCGSPCSSP
jgi:hypothetical protein